MDYKKMLNKYYSKLVIEAIIKSAIFGLIGGFSVSLAITVISMIAGFEGILIAILVGLFIALSGGVLLYFVKFKPDIKIAAARLDALGLDERVITMLDFQDDTSFIATKQRENATVKLSTVHPKKLLNFAVFKVPLIILGVCCFVTMSAMALPKIASSINNANSSSNSTSTSGGKTGSSTSTTPLTDEERIKIALDELRSIVDSQYDPNGEQKIFAELFYELHGMIDDLEGRLDDINGIINKLNEINEERTKIIKMIEDGIIYKLADDLYKILDEFKEKNSEDSYRVPNIDAGYDVIDKLVENIDTYKTREDKLEAIEETRQELVVLVKVEELMILVYRYKDDFSEAIINQAYGLISALDIRLATNNMTYEEKLKDIEDTKNAIYELLKLESIRMLIEQYAEEERVYENIIDEAWAIYNKLLQETLPSITDSQKRIDEIDAARMEIVELLIVNEIRKIIDDHSDADPDILIKAELIFDNLKDRLLEDDYASDNLKVKDLEDTRQEIIDLFKIPEPPLTPVYPEESEDPTPSDSVSNETDKSKENMGNVPEPNDELPIDDTKNPGQTNSSNSSQNQSSSNSNQNQNSNSFPGDGNGDIEEQIIKYLGDKDLKDTYDDAVAYFKDLMESGTLSIEESQTIQSFLDYYARLAENSNK